jgi:hypothetical protein
MEYTLYTTVDITNTGQYRAEPGKEADRWREQNFQTVLQTLGMRTNITYRDKPTAVTVKGSILGFNTSKIIKVWSFVFDTERNYPFGTTEDPTAFLTGDFDGVPFISGLDESMEQNYDVFVTEGPSRNIIFAEKL